MSERIVSAEASALSGRAAQNGETSAESRAFFDALMPRQNWSDVVASDHVMQLYEEDAHLLNALSRFTRAGLEAGEAAVVIATQLHREHLEARLSAHGLDLRIAQAQGQYIPMDASETLAQVMIDGWPDARRFVDVVEGVIAQAERRYPRVRVFGEMVALLWLEGNEEAALRLEELCNDLTKSHTLPLLCTYPLRAFSRAVHAEKFHTICAMHAHVIPAESYTILPSPDARLRTIAQLQQQANALAGEMAARQGLEQSMRQREEDLAEFLANAVAGVHKVGPDGTIRWANTAQLTLLGYTAEEYIGHHLAEFYVQRDVFDEMWAKLLHGERLHDYPANLRSKDGSIKHVRLHSNVLCEDGTFVHMQGFIQDITARAETTFREQAEVVETINRVGQTLSAELDLQKLVQAVTDAATALTGAKFGAFIFNVSDARGESYVLYTLSGVPREQFALFPLPRNTALFEPTFRGTGVVRCADVKQDPRYGTDAPHAGLPPGHLPVTSYLAVPVISRAGEVLGGLFFGHPETGVFTDRHERLVVGLAAQAAVAFDNARLFEAAQREIAERKQMEGVLRERELQYRHLVHALPAALYTCDTQGRVMLYNEAAVALWGREPQIGKDLWCGSWRIYEPDGTPLPLDQCPMAVAIREGRSIRGKEIVIERPDGTQRYVLPYPDPIRNASGEVVGAVNMLVDITEHKRAEATRELLASIVDSSDDAIIGQTLEGLITSWNRGAERLYGYTAADVLGKPLSLLIPPDLSDDLPQILMHLQRGEGIDHYETQRLHQDGTRRDVSLTISPIRDSAGRVVGASKVARDITERKRAEAALQQAHATLEQRVQERTALVELMQDITRAANEAPRSAEALQYAVDRLCAYTGWPVGHVYLAVAAGADRWAPTAIWHLDAPERFTAFQQATQTVEFAVGEGLIGRVGACGQPEWCVEVATDLTFHRRPAALSAGLKAGIAAPILVGPAVGGVLEFYVDEPLAPEPALLDAMTQIGTQLGRAIEREWAAEQLQHQQEALLQREKLAAMSTLLASVAHELNNPLTVILMQADLIGEDVRGGPLAEPVTEIAQAAARCERLVRQFLTLARQHPPERAAVALNTLVAETVELLAYPFRVDNVAVHLHLDDQVPPLWGDPHQLQQVLINLLTNAQQALRAAPGPREVTLTTQYGPAQHRITLAVADTGPGIPPALQARIFEPFFTTKPPGLGTGLGLPLCRGMVEAHGGTLEVTSALGHGATFRITLPVGAIPAPPPAPPGTAEGHTRRSHTILIVDDELILATGMARLLRRDGHTVDTAANGRLALAKLEERAYDLILCDVRMPELDGPSLYRRLERQQPYLCRRILFLTGDTLEPATQEFLEQSGAPCLTKPFTIAEARRAIQRALHPGNPAAPAGAQPAESAHDRV